MEDTQNMQTKEIHSYRDLLSQRGFVAFLLTQFLGALNDNLYRLLVSLLLVETAVHGETITLTGLIFLVPGILFSGYAGFFADKFSKRKVIIFTKCAELFCMILAMGALEHEGHVLLLGVVFAMATQTAFFSPSKYGIVPELVPREALSRANGLMEMTTYVAIILGGAFSGVLLDIFRHEMWVIASILILIAMMGIFSSFFIPKVLAKAKRRSFHWDPFSEVYAGIGVLRGHRFLTLVVAGISFFWCLAMVFQTNLLLYAEKVLHTTHAGTGFLMVMTAVGISVGSLLAGRISGERIEYGLIPLGLMGTALGITCVGYFEPGIMGSYMLLGMASIFTGLYIVPLKALLQDLPQPRQKGRLIATNNFFADLSMAVGLLMTLTLQYVFSFTPSEMFLFWGIVALFATCFAVYLLPAFFIRFMLFIIMHTIYRVRIYNAENFPKTGPALIVCNHVSFIDALLLAAVVPRFIRYLVHRDYYEMKAFKRLLDIAHAIPIQAGTDGVDAALMAAREALVSGHVVCIFAEGRITRTGNMLPFKRGFERIMEGVDAPIIPVHLDKLWDSIFSYSKGRFFWKLPRRIPIEIGVSFGSAMPGDSKAWEVREEVQELGVLAQARSQTKGDILPIRLLQAIRWRAWQMGAGDHTGVTLTYGLLIAKSVSLAKRLQLQYADIDRIGVWVPPSVDAMVLNLAIIFAGKMVINLPLSQDPTKLETHMRRAQLKHVFTTGDRIIALGNKAPAGLEDLSAWEATLSKLHRYYIRALLFLPAGWCLRMLGLPMKTPHDPAVVVWTHTEEKHPVALSHQGVIAPVKSFSQVFDDTSSRDRVMGVVPFYTTMGILGSFWFPLLSGMGVFYYGDAKREPRSIGAYVRQTHATILFDVAKTYHRYYEEVRPEDFSYIRFAISYGEPMDAVFLSQFEDRFGLLLLEGYGTPELGPISMNVPNVRAPGHLQRGSKPGSAGQPLPYVSVKIMSPDTEQELSHGVRGELWVKTPFKMLGYLDDPEISPWDYMAGWTATGTMALIDDEGFLFFDEIGETK
jgi:acyl-[acyl-carrier-protein]-phospholipid O-acyltransferase/long-chain-fatty-acid--[acyl-carrier-protein] ligase